MGARDKESRPDDIVVFSIIRDSSCGECGRELWKGEVLRMEDGRPLCLACGARVPGGRGGSRPGRSAAAKRLDPEALDLAVRAHVRHSHTEYETLLARGWTRADARAAVASRVEEILDAWRSAGSTGWVSADGLEGA